MKVNSITTKAYKAALKARAKAYAPYSQFKVGSTLVSKSGKHFSGCNIENASYGGTVCAERVALHKAVSEGAMKFSEIVVVTDVPRPSAPCGLCLQSLREFLAPDSIVWLANLDGIKEKYTFEQLLPVSFGPQDLQKAKRSK